MAARIGRSADLSYPGPLQEGALASVHPGALSPVAPSTQGVLRGALAKLRDKAENGARKVSRLFKTKAFLKAFVNPTPALVVLPLALPVQVASSEPSCGEELRSATTPATPISPEPPPISPAFKYPLLALSPVVITPGFQSPAALSLAMPVPQPVNELMGASRDELADIDAVLAAVAARPRPPRFVANMRDGLPYEHTAKFEALLKDTRSHAVSAQVLNPFVIFVGQLMPSRFSGGVGLKPVRIYISECLAIAERSVEAAKCCPALTSVYSTHPYKDSFSHELRMAFYKAILGSLEDDCDKAFNEERSLPAFLEMFRRTVEPRLENFVKKDAPANFKGVQPLRDFLQESLATGEISDLMKISPDKALKQLLRQLDDDLCRIHAEYIESWDAMRKDGLVAFDAHVHERLFAIELRWQGLLEIYKVLGGDPLHNKSLGEGPAALRSLLKELAPHRPLTIGRSLDRAACLIYEIDRLPLDDLSVITAGQMLELIKPCISIVDESSESIYLRARFQCLQAIHCSQISKMSCISSDTPITLATALSE